MSDLSTRSSLAEDLRADQRGVPRPEYRIGGDELLDLLNGDPRDPGHHGRIRALVGKARHHQGPAPQMNLLTWLASHDIERPAAPETYDHPMTFSVRKPKRALTGEELAWVADRKVADPSTVSNEDARLLHELEMVAESEAGRRLVAGAADPVRRVHDRRAEEVQLRHRAAQLEQADAWRTAQNHTALLPWVEEAMVAEARAAVVSQLKPDAPAETREQMLVSAETWARYQAKQRLVETWNATRTERAQALEATRSRLAQLASGAVEPTSTKAKIEQETREAQLAAQQAQRERDARRDGPADLLESFGHEPVRGVIPNSIPADVLERAGVSVDAAPGEPA